ncbi:hypothetical protein MNBD_UNCLBAC01-691 [hydrothermal vent metagenome]|uniref:Uncharacterized protein n=1 Tax=hydrothermal vent metagenome TaxID=652676 RepID=A0A3B1DJ14_9ZZZZ
MRNTQVQLEWNVDVKKKYDTMIAKMPMFHRSIAKEVVDKKAVINAQERGADKIEEADVVRAFLTEVPKAFYSLMIRIMDEVGFDAKKYE